MPIHLIIRCSDGKTLNSWPNPNPTMSSMIAKPIHMPDNSGRLFLMPKFTAEVITIILLGPGVTDDEIANSVTASIYSIILLVLVYFVILTIMVSILRS